MKCMYAYCLNILGQKENGSFIGLKKRLKIDPSINNDFGCNSPAGTNKKIRPSLSFDEDLSLAASGGGGGGGGGAKKATSPLDFNTRSMSYRDPRSSTSKPLFLPNGRHGNNNSNKNNKKREPSPLLNSTVIDDDDATTTTKMDDGLIHEVGGFVGGGTTSTFGTFTGKNAGKDLLNPFEGRRGTAGR